LMIRRPLFRWSVPRAFGRTSLNSRPSKVKIGGRRVHRLVAISPRARRDAEQACCDPRRGCAPKLAPKATKAAGRQISGFRPFLSQDRLGQALRHRRGTGRRRTGALRRASTYCVPTPRSPPLQVMLRYRDLLRVEQFVCAKSRPCSPTRPDLPQQRHGDPRPLCSALFWRCLLAKELEDRLRRQGVAAEWGDIPARSRPVAADPARAGWQALPAAHPHHRRRR